MTVHTCDICKAEVDQLTLLLDEYQTENIKELCKDCMTLVNNKLWDMRKERQQIEYDRIHQFMVQLTMVDIFTLHQWILDYRDSDTNERLGQYLINQLSQRRNTSITDPDVFYETDDAKAVQLFVLSYVYFDSDDHENKG